MLASRKRGPHAQTRARVQEHGNSRIQRQRNPAKKNE